MSSDDLMQQLAAIDWTSMTRADSLAALYGWSGTGTTVMAAPAAGEPALVLAPKLWERMQSFGLTEKPRECCGVGIGPDGEVREFIPIEHVSADAERVDQRAVEHDWKVTFVFRTSLSGDAMPNMATDTVEAWPNAVHAVLDLVSERPEMRTWIVRHGELHAVSMTSD